MKSLLIAAVVAAGLMFGAASSAEAGGPHHGHHGNHGHYHSYYGPGPGRVSVSRSYYRPPHYGPVYQLPPYYGRSYYNPGYGYYNSYRYYGGSGIQVNGRGFNFGIRF
ncbi:hypothetical protein [Blastopirellula marina]|uniref:Uncharacterized protein n=1 Tax=Blastopirellula marina TaxID=124 RepID=A0A2S8F7M4_9BACT|nr:hypothetical protein [Blastopirellula marina]PQO28156.1 hypothetical protein C5Y98_24950 [Blastopirellula marina]PTL41696.1 hypothetical protein C5Y97_24965 [Blastopirellula marina]